MCSPLLGSMAFNGHQHDVDTIDNRANDDEQDGTPTKLSRSDTEGPVDPRAEPDNEPVGPAGRVAGASGRTSSSRARQRSDSVKKTRPRMYPVFQEGDGLGVVAGNCTMAGRKLAECSSWKRQRGI